MSSGFKGIKSVSVCLLQKNSDDDVVVITSEGKRKKYNIYRL